MNIKPGLTGRAGCSVTDAITAPAMKSGSLEVLATPALVALLEEAACQALEEHLEADQTTVGISINIRHLAPTPPGMKIKARAELLEVEGKKLHFQVEAEDEKELIGRGQHSRVIVPAASFLKQAQNKK